MPIHIIDSFVIECRGRHASKLTEEEEDEEYLKEEEDGLSNTRLVTQPSCKCPCSLSCVCLCMCAWLLLMS